jgi:molybdate transport system ATP-binding protein
LLDEVATGLDDRNRRRLTALLSARSLRGTGWICSAHRREDVPPGATHLLWLQDGKVRYAGALSRARLGEALATSRTRRAVVARDAGITAGRGQSHPAGPGRSLDALLTLHDADVWVDGSHLLRGIDLAVARGQCWVVHGANGSGKTTLLRTLYGDHAVADGGSIRRAGMAPGVPLEVFRARTGLVAPHLQTDYPRQLTVLDTVVSGMHSSIGLNYPATAAEKKRARAALRAFAMQAFADRSLAEMSYGQVRRILFARAHVARPRLLLLDEAFTGLNPVVRAGLLGWLERRIDAGVTVVMATHYRREWPGNATHELVLSRGRVEYAGKLRR